MSDRNLYGGTNVEAMGRPPLLSIPEGTCKAQRTTLKAPSSVPDGPHAGDVCAGLPRTLPGLCRDVIVLHSRDNGQDLPPCPSP